MSPSASSQEQHVSEELRNKLSEVLIKNGISEEIEDITMIDPEELKGEHMATATVYVTITFKNNARKQKNLFMKKFTDSAVHTQGVKDMRLMEKESAFYNEFLPAARAFSEKHLGKKDFLNFFPNFLYGDDDMIILDNHVLDDTFIMLSKEDLQNLETAKYALGNLARFHSVSYCMLQSEGKEAFKSKWELVASESLIGEKNPMAHAFFDNGLSTCLTILKATSIEGSAAAIEKINSYIGVSYRLATECIIPKDEDEVLVINHGDCWNNNMLFKIEEINGEQIIKDHMFVDLQITRLGSPTLDLIYFMHTSVKSSVRRNHVKEMLKHYYEVFTNSVKNFKVEFPWTFEEFFDDYKKRVLFGQLTNLNFMSVIGALKEFKVEEMGTTPEEMVAYFIKVINNWIANNPDKSAEISREIILLFKEQTDLNDL